MSEEDKKVSDKGGTKKENPTAKNENINKDPNPPVKKKNIFQKHPFVFVLLVALIIAIIWGNLNANRIEKKLTEQHNKALQAERELLGKTLANTMALTLRSELTRDNKEQAEQYMVEFLKSDLTISRVSFMDQSSKKITFSTDKSFESKTIEDDFILNTDESNYKNIEEGLLLTAPVNGLSRQLGVLIINWDF
jgi:hypothetical protein